MRSWSTITIENTCDCIRTDSFAIAGSSIVMCFLVKHQSHLCFLVFTLRRSFSEADCPVNFFLFNSRRIVIIDTVLLKLKLLNSLPVFYGVLKWFFASFRNRNLSSAFDSFLGRPRCFFKFSYPVLWKLLKVLRIVDGFFSWSRRIAEKDNSASFGSTTLTSFSNSTWGKTRKQNLLYLVVLGRARAEISQSSLVEFKKLVRVF